MNWFIWTWASSLNCAKNLVQGKVESGCSANGIWCHNILEVERYPVGLHGSPGDFVYICSLRSDWMGVKGKIKKSLGNFKEHLRPGGRKSLDLGGLGVGWLCVRAGTVNCLWTFSGHFSSYPSTLGSLDWGLSGLTVLYSLGTLTPSDELAAGTAYPSTLASGPKLNWASYKNILVFCFCNL